MSFRQRATVWTAGRAPLDRAFELGRDLDCEVDEEAGSAGAQAVAVPGDGDDALGQLPLDPQRDERLAVDVLRGGAQGRTRARRRRSCAVSGCPRPDDILKLYLDRAYLGGGTFGVDAAAQFYFNKSARDVNLSEAAMLAGLFKAPSKFAPHINLPAARARANVVLDNLVEAGFMTEGQVFGARRNPATVIDRRDERCAQLLSRLGVRRDEEARRARCRAPCTSASSWRGSRSTSTCSGRRSRRSRIRCASTAANTSARQAAAVLMEHDGAVRAMVGGRDYGESQFNRATDALRQPGSSFKPYVYAAALQSGGFKPTSVVVDSPVCIGNWCPKNYSGGYSGAMSLTRR